MTKSSSFMRWYACMCNNVSIGMWTTNFEFSFTLGARRCSQERCDTIAKTGGRVCRGILFDHGDDPSATYAHDRRYVQKYILPLPLFRSWELGSNLRFLSRWPVRAN